jgi:hypothetical protein
MLQGEVSRKGAKLAKDGGKGFFTAHCVLFFVPQKNEPWEAPRLRAGNLRRLVVRWSSRCLDVYVCVLSREARSKATAESAFCLYPRSVRLGD